MTKSKSPLSFKSDATPLPAPFIHTLEQPPLAQSRTMVDGATSSSLIGWYYRTALGPMLPPFSQLLFRDDVSFLSNFSLHCCCWPAPGRLFLWVDCGDGCSTTTEEVAMHITRPTDKRLNLFPKHSHSLAPKFT